MFAVYNNGSVLFRNTSDNLYALNNVDRTQNVKLHTQEGTITDFSGEIDKYSQNAISSYKKMAKIDKEDNIYHVKDIMSENCIYIDRNKTMFDAYNYLVEYNISQIPVISENKKIDSMINKKFILDMVVDDIDNARYVMDKKIKDFFLPDVITTDPISDIRRVAKVMIDFKLDAIPVVTRAGSLVGIVSKTDIIRALSEITSFKLWT